MPRKKKASASPATVDATGYRGGVRRPIVTASSIDKEKTRAAKTADGTSVGGQRWRQAAAGEKTAGMMIDNVQTSRAFMTGYAMESYRSSYANGLVNRSGTYDIPSYFVQMNQLNGGILYWPVTLAEKYQWYRYWCRTDAYIGRAMDLLSDLPMSKLTLNMPKMEGKEKLRQEILDFYQYQIEKVNLYQLCLDILYEINCIGNCYPFAEYDEEKKMWSKITILPPEEVYVFQYPFSDVCRVEYRPERLLSLIKSGGKEMVMGQSGLSEEILEHIPHDIVQMVQEHGCIVMDNDPMTGSFVDHIVRRKTPYFDLGASIIERVLVPMLQKENYRYTQLSLANRNMTPKNLITAPGLLQEELDTLRAMVDQSYLDPDYSIITNYEVNWQQIGAQDRLINLDSEYERIENQCFAAMGVTRELLTGEGTYAGSKITVEILNTVFLMSREVLKNYVEKRLFLPLAEKHGWYEDGAFGVRKYYYPELGFNRLTIRDNNEVFESMFQLYQKGSLNVDIIYELFNLNGDEVRKKLIADAFTVKDATFNRLLEEANADAGRNLLQTTDVLKRMADGLGLQITNPPNAPQGAEQPAGVDGEAEGGQDDAGQGFSGFGGMQGQPDDSGAQGDAGSSTEEIADAVAEVVPPSASDEDLVEIVQKVTEDSEPVQENKPDLQKIADAISESVPGYASDEDIAEITQKVTE